MEDIDKNADGFIDLEEYIGESHFSVFLRRSWETLKDMFTNKNNLPHGSTLSTSLTQTSVGIRGS